MQTALPHARLGDDMDPRLTLLGTVCVNQASFVSFEEISLGGTVSMLKGHGM